jgi:hypothetical protein
MSPIFDDLNIKTCTNNSVYLYDFTTVRIKIVDKPENICACMRTPYITAKKSGLTRAGD